MERKKLGEILIEAKLITQEQLETALILQKTRNKILGQLLVELGYITENQLLEAFFKKFAIPYMDCSSVVVLKEVLALVPAELAHKKRILPIEIKGGDLVLAMADPLDYKAIDEVTFLTGRHITPRIATEYSIIAAIDRNYGSTEKIWDTLADIGTAEKVEFSKKTEEAEEDVNTEALFKISEAPPVVKLVTMVLVNAVKTRATDIHIEPREKEVGVRYRIDGEMRTVLRFPKRLQQAVTSRVKIISNLNITIRRVPQDGRGVLRYEGRSIDLRVSILPSAFGETIVIRILDSKMGLIPLSRLGIPESIIKSVIEVLSQPQGMLLVTGPTGSGKTTTLYSLLQQLPLDRQSAVTIEDPIEYELKEVTQVAVNEKIGMTFAGALRAILRQDPDIIMVGEIRDFETAEIATKSALTGHLVLSTLHTNNTAATIVRMLDLGLKPYLVSAAVSAILAQRLVRKICEKCRVPAEIPRSLLENFPHYSVRPLTRCFIGKGCPECENTGYRGRVGVYEFLHMSTKIRAILPRFTSEDEILEAARAEGFVTLFEDALHKVEAGVTTVEEVLAKTPYYG